MSRHDRYDRMYLCTPLTGPGLACICQTKYIVPTSRTYWSFCSSPSSIRSKSSANSVRSLAMPLESSTSAFFAVDFAQVSVCCGGRRVYSEYRDVKNAMNVISKLPIPIVQTIECIGVKTVNAPPPLLFTKLQSPERTARGIGGMRRCVRCGGQSMQTPQITRCFPNGVCQPATDWKCRLWLGVQTSPRTKLWLGAHC